MPHIFLGDVKHRSRGEEWFLASRGDGALRDLFERITRAHFKLPPGALLRVISWL